ncbi:MAG: metal ABC transporter permease, partial [Christensenellaceae bacterium]|nr:metal ABC transporter permease [Christensenellaceae bacterium]
ILTAIVLITIIVFFQDWKSFLFDPEFAWINGLNSIFFQYLLLVLVALTVVIMIHVTGIMLVIALLTAPAASACLISKRFSHRMIFATIISFFNCFTGLTLSYYLNISSNATIIIVSIFLYIILFAFKTMFKLRQA